MSGSDSGSRRLRTLLSTRNRALLRVIDTLAKALDHDVNVLILGEPGTGKNFVAEALHACGNRAKHPFVTIECAAVPAEIFEAELFGFEKGAFTDAQTRKTGRIELAQRGTIYFDEVGSVSPAIQAKLLRVIQERTFSRLGSTQPLSLDVRVIASSNLDLAAALESGAFRQDLYYRLNVLNVILPPLRERPEDIAPLARRFLHDAAKRLQSPARAFDPSALEMLEDYAWPGNIRELRNIVDRAALLAAGPSITPAELPLDGFLSGPDLIASAISRRWSLEELEKRYIREVLRQTGNNYSRAAEILGINRKTLFEKRKRFGLETRDEGRGTRDEGQGTRDKGRGDEGRGDEGRGQGVRK
jgi:DNA-binding NtrC family response regulator